MAKADHTPQTPSQGEQNDRRGKYGPEPRPLAERFHRGYRVSECGCWLWQRARVGGYGVMTVVGGGERKSVKAHRISYELHHGPIPEGQQVLHDCDVRACVNPSHLHLGSHKDNMAEMAARGRAAKGEDNHFGRVKYEGASNGFAKLTPDDVVEIRAATGRLVDIGARFGISKAQAGKIRNRQLWQSVP